MMNAKAQELGLERTHFVRPDGLDARAHYSSALDVTRLAESRCASARSVGSCVCRTDTIAGGRHLQRGTTCWRLQGPVRREDGSHRAAGWCEVAAVKPQRCHALYDRARKPDSFATQCRSRVACCGGGSRATGRCGSVPRGRVYLRAGVGYGKPAVPIVAARQGGTNRPDRPAARRARDRPERARASCRTRTARR